MVADHQVVKPAMRLGQDWSTCLAGAIILGLIAVGIYGHLSLGLSGLTAGLLLSGACLLIGALLGFLFGIPRALQVDSAAETTHRPPALDSASVPGPRPEPLIQYRANTNLEQISDWLTKILVGVGLTQITRIPEFFSSAGSFFGPSVGPLPSSSVFSVAIILFFATSGFLFGYLWTRLFLAPALARSDLDALAQARTALEDVTRRVSAFEQDAHEQSQIDARAIALANQYLTTMNPSNVSVDEMKKAIVSASAPVKVQLFYQAQAIRRSSWQDNAEKPKLERTIPIFEALIESDPDRFYHSNYGQLAFALKDKRKPDYKKAEENLALAIDIRGQASQHGHEIYEINRAICRIKLDTDFAAGRPTEVERRSQIMADLEIAKTAFPRLFDDEEIARWLNLNKQP